MMEVEYNVVEESDNFYIAVGTMPKGKLQEYLVVNKAYGVIEYSNPILYFAREWARQMDEALDGVTEEGKSPAFPPPNGKAN
jgi:hypothetical protein